MQCVLTILFPPSKVKAPQPPQDEIPHGEQPTNASPSLADEAENSSRGIEYLIREVDQLRLFLLDQSAQNAARNRSLENLVAGIEQRLTTLEHEVQRGAAIALAAAEAEAPGAQAPLSNHWDGQVTSALPNSSRLPVSCA